MLTAKELIDSIDKSDEGQALVVKEARLACRMLKLKTHEVAYLCSESSGNEWSTFWTLVGPNITNLGAPLSIYSSGFGIRCVVYHTGGPRPYIFVQSCDEGTSWWNGVNAVYMPVEDYIHLGLGD